MKYCVVKNTTTVIDGSINEDVVMLQNAQNAGFTANQVEILTQEQYDDRKALEPQPIPQPTKLDVLEEQIATNTDYLIDMDVRVLMLELGLL